MVSSVMHFYYIQAHWKDEIEEKIGHTAREDSDSQNSSKDHQQNTEKHHTLRWQNGPVIVCINCSVMTINETFSNCLLLERWASVALVLAITSSWLATSFQNSVSVHYNPPKNSDFIQILITTRCFLNCSGTVYSRPWVLQIRLSWWC